MIRHHRKQREAGEWRENTDPSRILVVVCLYTMV